MGLPRRSACDPGNDGPASSTVSRRKPTARSIRSTRLWRSTCSMSWPAPARRSSIEFCAGSATAGSLGINRLSSSCVGPPAWRGPRRSWRRAASCPRSSKPAGRTCCAIIIVRLRGFAPRIMKPRTWSSAGSKHWSAHRCDALVAFVWAIRPANTALLRRRRSLPGNRPASDSRSARSSGNEDRVVACGVLGAGHLGDRSEAGGLQTTKPVGRTEQAAYVSVELDS